MLMVQRLANGWTVAAVAQAQGVTPKTVRKWRDRYARRARPAWRIARRARIAAPTG
jgi:transposase-like protein